MFMNRFSNSQIVIAFVGLFVVLGTFIAGQYVELPITSQITISIGTIILTVILEIFISINKLRSDVRSILPAFENSESDRKSLLELGENIRQLRNRDEKAFAEIAISHFTQSQNSLIRATGGNDFDLDNTFYANLIAISKLEKGESFLAFSAISNPDFWKYDPHFSEYLKQNYQKVKHGSHIKRIFMLTSNSEFSVLEPIMREQKDNGIDIKYATPELLKNINTFDDFSILPEQGLGIFVPSMEKPLTCTATINPNLVSRMRNEFEKMYDVSNQLP